MNSGRTESPFLATFVGIFRLSEDFPIVPEDGNKALPSLNNLVEIIGFVTLDAEGTPFGDLHILCIRPRNSAHGPKPCFLAPHSDYDRIGLLSFWTDHAKQVVLMAHPMDKKPFIVIADLGDAFAQLETFAREALNGGTNKTLDGFRRADVVDFDVRSVQSVSINIQTAVMEGGSSLITGK